MDSNYDWLTKSVDNNQPDEQDYNWLTGAKGLVTKRLIVNPDESGYVEKPPGVYPLPDDEQDDAQRFADWANKVSKVRPMPTLWTPGAEGIKTVFGSNVNEGIETQASLMSPKDELAMIARLSELVTLAKDPYTVLKGVVEFASAIPGFAMGMVGAGTSLVGELGKRVIQDKSFNFEDLYMAASKGMEEQSGIWNRGVSEPLGRLMELPRKAGEGLASAIFGDPSSPLPKPMRGDSSLVGQALMAPLEAISGPLHALADSDVYKDYPNSRGIIKFAADVAGLLFMHRVYKGGKDKFIEDVKPIVEKAKIIAEKEMELKTNVDLDKKVRDIKQAEIELEKVQIEVEAAAVQKNINYGDMIKEDLKSTGEKVERVRSDLYRVGKDPDAQVHKGNLYVERVAEKIRKLNEKKLVDKIEGKEEPLVKTEGKEEIPSGENIWYHGRGSDSKGSGWFTQSLEKAKLYAEAQAKGGQGKPVIDINYSEDFPGSVFYLRETDSAPVSPTEYRKWKDELGIIKSLVPKPRQTIEFGKEEVPGLKGEDRKKIERSDNFDFRLELAAKYGLDPDKQLVIGTSYKSDGSTAIRLNTLFIPEKQRKSSIGTNLMHELQAYAQKTGQDIEATATRPYVSKFFEGLGFDKTESGSYVWKPDRKIIERSKPLPITPENITKMYMEDFGLSKSDAIEAAKLDGEFSLIDGYKKDTRNKVNNMDDYRSMMKYYEETLAEAKRGKVEVSDILDDASPFRNLDADYNKGMGEVLSEHLKGAKEDPEIKFAAVLNGFNRFLDGAELDAPRLRNVLSDMAANPENFRRHFLEDRANYPGNYEGFVKNVSDAAAWAKRTERIGDRKIIERSGVDLNIMVPFNKIPDLVFEYFSTKKAKKDFKDTGLKLGNAYRNKRLWRETGFWLDKDNNWRYEIPNYVNIYDPKNTVRHEWNKLRDEGPKMLPKVLVNEKLYKEVPELKDIIVMEDKKISSAGYFRDWTKTIVLKDAADFETLAHEIQHAVEHYANTKFKGTNVTAQEFKQMTEFTDKLLASAKSEEVKEMTRTFRDDFRRNYNNPDAIPTITLNDLYTEARRHPEDYWELQRIDREVFKDDPFDAYRKDPGEMIARLESKRSDMAGYERKREAPWETLDIMLEQEGYGKEAGMKLYSNIDPVLAYKNIKKDAKRVMDYVNKTREAKKFNVKEGVERLRKGAVASLWERSGNLSKSLREYGPDGVEIDKARQLTKGAGARATNMLRQMNKEVYGGISKPMEKLIDALTMSSRMIDIAKYKTEKQFKHPDGLKPKDFIKFLNTFHEKEVNGFRNLTPREAHDLYHLKEDGSVGGRTGIYFDWMKKALKDMYEEGELLTEKMYEELKVHNYKRLESVKKIFDRKHKTKVKGRKITVYDSGIDTLQRGKDTDIYESSSKVMALEVFNRAYGRIENNNANRLLLDLARKDPGNPFVRTVENKGDPKPPRGWGRIYAFEEGERKSLWISPDVGSEWMLTNPDMSYRSARAIRMLSGAPITRSMATGIEPGFAFVNLPRDIVHSWFTARTSDGKDAKPIYNSNIPMFPLQMGRDLATVSIDAMLKKGRYNDYINEGGGMEWLADQGRIFQKGRHVEGPMDKIWNVLGYPGLTSEVMVRLAVRERSIREQAKKYGLTMEQARESKGIRKEATYVARNTMDFEEGGWFIKGVDQAIPYLNATIVATRGMAKAFKENPLKSTWKMAQLCLLTTGVYVAMKKNSPETFKELRGSKTMENYLVLPLGDSFSYEDEKGQIRYPYLKVPLDPFQRFFKVFFEGVIDKTYYGEDFDVDRTLEALKNQSPVGLDTLPPVLSSAMGYFGNKDFWQNEDVWKKSGPYKWTPPVWAGGREDEGSKIERIPGRTPAAMEDLGDVTGLSPERMRFALEEIFTSGSTWSYLAGVGYEKAFGDVPKKVRDQHLAETLSKIPVIKRFFGVTNPYDKFRGAVDEAEGLSSAHRQFQNAGLDMRAEAFIYDKTMTGKEVRDFARSFKDIKIEDRLLERFEFQKSIKGMPNRGLWLRLKGLNIEARAKVYMGEKEKDPQMIRDGENWLMSRDKTGFGIFTNGFYDELDKIRRERMKDIGEIIKAPPGFTPIY
uniref:Putative acetyltransferase n=1 Tax=viral metagenome TaxID=1070528 RepID=A0A6M3KAI0_9ZZZZ